jgi:hypothetical protein
MDEDFFLSLDWTLNARLVWPIIKINSKTAEFLFREVVHLSTNILLVTFFAIIFVFREEQLIRRKVLITFLIMISLRNECHIKRKNYFVYFSEAKKLPSV